MFFGSFFWFVFLVVFFCPCGLFLTWFVSPMRIRFCPITDIFPLLILLLTWTSRELCYVMLCLIPDAGLTKTRRKERRKGRGEKGKTEERKGQKNERDFIIELDVNV